MMEFCVNTPNGLVALSMTEFFAVWEHRLTLDQVLLQRRLHNSS